MTGYDSDGWSRESLISSLLRGSQPEADTPASVAQLLFSDEILEASPIGPERDVIINFRGAAASLPPQHLSPSASPSPSPSMPAVDPPPQPQAPRGSPARHWCFTLNHPSDDEFYDLGSLCDQTEPGHVRYLVMGQEVGETGTPHLQGYLELGIKERLPWLRSHVNARAHYELRRGPREAARDYCMKDGAWIEFGEWREEERGRRRDVEMMVEQASQGTPFYDAACDEPTTALFPFAYAKLLEGRALSATPAWRDVRVVVKIGPTGTGKTRSAFDDFWPDLFVQDFGAGNGIWWDGYSGQTLLLLDDFAGPGVSFVYLLRLLDGYPVRLPVKGAFTYGTWTEVVITTNKSIISWFPKEGDISPLLRRIHHVERYAMNGSFRVEYLDHALL